MSLGLGARPDRVISRTLAGVAEHLYPRPKVLILNYPHNPSTTIVERDFFVEVVKLAKRFGFLVIHDFAYKRRLLSTAIRALGFLECTRGEGRGRRSLTTMSKGYNMAGWRLGFCGNSAEMVVRWKTIKGYYDYGTYFEPDQVPASWQYVRARSWWSGKRQDTRTAATCSTERSAAHRLGGKNRQKATMFVWAKYPKEWRDKMGSIDFSMKLLEEAEVAVSPGRGFGELGEGYLRLALVENEHRLRQAVRQIGQCLSAPDE